MFLRHVTGFVQMGHMYGSVKWCIVGYIHSFAIPRTNRGSRIVLGHSSAKDRGLT